MISVCIVGIENSGNLGAIARIMKNFNVNKLFLVNPNCEVLCDESRTRAMHGYSVLEKAAIIKSLKNIKCDYLIATSAKLGAGNTLFRVPVTPRILSENIDSYLHYCVVLGRESKGLYNDEIKECDVLLHIPSSKSYPTLNISHALSIILYELFVKKNVNAKLASRVQRGAVIMLARKALKSVENRENFLEVLSNVINRGFIREKEARALSGMFSKIIKKHE